VKNRPCQSDGEEAKVPESTTPRADLFSEVEEKDDTGSDRVAGDIELPTFSPYKASSCKYQDREKNERKPPPPEEVVQKLLRGSIIFWRSVGANEKSEGLISIRKNSDTTAWFNCLFVLDPDDKESPPL